MDVYYHRNDDNLGEKELNIKPCPICGRNDCLHLTIRNKSEGCGMREDYWTVGNLKCHYCGCMTVSINDDEAACTEELRNNWNSNFFRS